MIVQEVETYSDSFTQFTIALLEDFDFEQALVLANQIGEDARNDIFLRAHAGELKRQACLYVFEVQSRLFKDGGNLTKFCRDNGLEVEGAAAAVSTNLREQGLIVDSNDDSVLTIHGYQFDVKGKIHSLTSDLVRRTEELNKSLMTKVP